MRLSLQLRRPLHEVLAWPLWVVHTYAEFLAREPAVEDRLEVMLAQLSAQYGAVHRGPGMPAPRINDYLLFRDAWAANEGQVRYQWRQTLARLAQRLGGTA